MYKLFVKCKGWIKIILGGLGFKNFIYYVICLEVIWGYVLLK